MNEQRPDWVVLLFSGIVVVGLIGNVLLTWRIELVVAENRKKGEVIEAFYKQVEKIQDRLDAQHNLNLKVEKRLKEIK